MSLGKSQGESLILDVFLLDEMIDMFLSYFFGIPPPKSHLFKVKGYQHNVQGHVPGLLSRALLVHQTPVISHGDWTN